jgi:hypothetical protein
MEKISFTITIYCDSKTPFRDCRRRSKQENISQDEIREY